MIDVGIFSKDIAVIDRSLGAGDRYIVLALLDGEFTIKHYRHRDGQVWLQTEAPAYANIFWQKTASSRSGAVTRSIRMLI